MRKKTRRIIKPKSKKEGTVPVVSFTPVRGDTVSFWSNEGGYRYALVLNAQDKEATVLTVDNDRITLPYESLRECNDNRMKMLREMSEEDATQHREDYLDAWIVKCQQRADDAAIARGAPLDEHGNIIRYKPGRKPSDEKMQRVNALRDEFIALVEKSEHPVTKSDIGELIPAGIYSDVIKAAVDTGKITKNGTRRGTNYRIPDRVYPETPKQDKPEPTVDSDVLDEIVSYIVSNGPTSKADLVSHYGLSTTEWSDLRFVLQNDPRLRIEGERRGTRYVGV